MKSRFLARSAETETAIEVSARTMISLGTCVLKNCAAASERRGYKENMLCSLQYKKDGKIGAVTIGGDGIGNKTIMMRIFHRGRKRTQTNKTQDEKKNRGKNLFRERVLFLTHHISISSQGVIEFSSRQEWRLRETQLLSFRNAPCSFRASGPAFKGRHTKGRFKVVPL